MNLYAFGYAEHIAYSLVAFTPNVHQGQFTCGRFRNGELCVQLQTPPRGECLVLGTVQPPEEHLANFLLLCDTVKAQGANSVTAILPYLAYSRQDKLEPGKSLAAAWVGRLLKASGVDRVLTLDLHSRHAIELFPIPLVSLSVAGLLADVIQPVDEEVSIVAPDEGGIARCERLRVALKASNPVIHCRKRRRPGGVASELVGRVTRRAIVCDDILDTGNTLVACCERLVEAGTKQISVYVTHGLFTGAQWQRLWDLNVDSITCTDSVPGAPPTDERIKVVECAPALVARLRREDNAKELVHG